MRVKISLPDMESWRDRWPCSNLHGLDGVWFEFDARGNLIDLGFDNGDADRWDGPELLALSHAAQAGEIGFREVE